MEHNFEELTDTTMTIGELDGLIKGMMNAKKDYEIKSAASKEAYAIFQGVKNKVLQALKEHNKKDYSIPGLCKLSTVHKISVKTPKSTDDKIALRGYIWDKYGDDGVISYFKIGSRELNKLYKDLSESAHARGQTFQMPGVEAPTSASDLSIRKG